MRVRTGDMMIKEVAQRLRVGHRTLEGWLANDLLRAPDDRRFQYHTRRGRKRIWTETQFGQLKAAIERESEPGGVLAGSGSRKELAIGTRTAPFVRAAVQSACDEVLGFPLRPAPRTKRKPP